MLSEERIQYQDYFFLSNTKTTSFSGSAASTWGILGYHAPRISCQVRPSRAVYHKIELEPGAKPPTI